MLLSRKAETRNVLSVAMFARPNVLSGVVPALSLNCVRELTNTVFPNSLREAGGEAGTVTVVSIRMLLGLRNEISFAATVLSRFRFPSTTTRAPARRSAAVPSLNAVVPPDQLIRCRPSAPINSNCAPAAMILFTYPSDFTRSPALWPDAGSPTVTLVAAIVLSAAWKVPFTSTNTPLSSPAGAGTMVA